MEINNKSYSVLSENSQKLPKTGNSDQKKSSKTENEFTDQEKRELTHLKKEDARVKTHENAHKAAAGELSKGTPNYDYKMGPDGKRYAVSGHVNIDSSEVPDDPEKTIEKAKKIRASALAPADPSSQDMQVAREAAQMEIKAKRELAESKKESDNKNSIQNKISASYKQDTSYLNPKFDSKF